MIDFLKELEELFRGNGVDISGMPGEVTIEDGKLFISKHMALDFFEHDKKVAEEKDAKIEILKKELSKANDVIMTFRSICTVDAIEYFVEENYSSLIVTLPQNTIKNNKIKELEDRHQSDCIRINQLLTTIDVLTERYQKLREVHGL